MDQIYTVTFNHHDYPLSIHNLDDDFGIALIDLIHQPQMMRDVAVEANRYINKNIGNDIDIIVTPECRSITLVTALALMNGCEIVMLRKALKTYEENGLYWSVQCKSMTSSHPSNLFLTEEKAALMKNKRVLVLDDVASTGETFIAIHSLLSQVEIKADFFAIFNEDSVKESNFASLPSYYFLKTLPIFTK